MPLLREAAILATLVTAEQRPDDVLESMCRSSSSYCLVTDDSAHEALGVVDVRTLSATQRNRLFIDLIPGAPPLVLSASLSLEDAIANMEDAGVDMASIAGPQGKLFGVATRQHALDLLELLTAKHGRQSALETLDQFARVVEQTDDLVLITDRDGVVQYVNRAFEEVTGYRSETLVGTTPRQLKSGAHPPEFYEELWRTILDGQPFRAEIVNRKANGETFVEEKTISPILDESGAITHFVSTGKDVTKRKEAEARARQTENLERFGQLVSTVAHEVRNPLFGLMATVDALDVQELGSNLDPYLACLRRDVGRLTGLMNDLLTYGRPAVLAKAPCGCDRIVSEAVTMCTRIANETGVRIEARLRPDLPEIAADSIRLAEAVRNLIENAIQHSRTDGVVIVETSTADVAPVRSIEIRVSDSGSGIPPEDLSRVFDPFFTRRKGGTGLGLSIARRIVEAHAGRVSARNLASGGAVFIVRLPAT